MAVALTWDRHFGVLADDAVRTQQLAELTAVANHFLHLLEQALQLPAREKLWARARGRPFRLLTRLRREASGERFHRFIHHNLRLKSTDDMESWLTFLQTEIGTSPEKGRGIHPYDNPTNHS